MKLIIGLGNPGEKYIGTRHNLGFAVLDEYAKKHLPSTITWEKSQKLKVELLRISPEVLLVKPQTYMNDSGLGVKLVTSFYKLPIDQVIVVHDDLDLLVGKIKIRLGGSGAGHHGIESIIQSLGSDKFIRVRLGIGNENTQYAEHGQDTINIDHFVLQPFTAKERVIVKRQVKHAVQAIDTLLDKGLEVAQNQYN